MGRIHHQVALPLCHTLQNPPHHHHKKEPSPPRPVRPGTHLSAPPRFGMPPPLESFGPRARCRAGLPRSIGRGGVFECRVRAARRRAPFLAALLPPEALRSWRQRLTSPTPPRSLGTCAGARTSPSPPRRTSPSPPRTSPSPPRSLGYSQVRAFLASPEIPVGLARSEIDEGGFRTARA